MSTKSYLFFPFAIMFSVIAFIGVIALIHPEVFIIPRVIIALLICQFISIAYILYKMKE